MLVNGAKLGYGTEEGSYTNLVGCVELPDIGGDANKVDHSAVDDEYKQYELGQKDAGDLVFKFRYRSKAEKDQYKTMREKEAAGEDLYFCLCIATTTASSWPTYTVCMTDILPTAAARLIFMPASMCRSSRRPVFFPRISQRTSARSWRT